MGFGSYDESEQQNQEIDTDDERDAVNVHENEHKGELSFETEASTENLIDKLADIKEDAGDEEE